MNLPEESLSTTGKWPQENDLHTISLADENVPSKEEIQFSLGPYQILKRIGKGGMGEVFLAFDPRCGRRVALKRIRTDLKSHKRLLNRFLREARITSQLTHPAIIPIYAIHTENDLIYYTMPYVEGETLKKILRKTYQQKQKGKKLDQLGGSIPALIRIFLTLCHAIAYAQSRGLLHRDIKPENVLISNYGQISIFDWGLAKFIDEKEEEEEGKEGEEEKDSPLPLKPTKSELTSPGKILGTVSYMAPEIAEGSPATVQTEVYALGVVLYQILTLYLPFQRNSIDDFKKNYKKEQVPDPSQAAPYRDIPQILTRITKKALSSSLEERYQTVDLLIQDIENYIEGRSEWFPLATLDIHNKGDWEFHENVLLTEYHAVALHEVTTWVSLMVSRASFPENTKLEAKVRMGKDSQGIGFLLCVPSGAERTHLSEGYCLWLGTEKAPGTHLFRSNVEVMDRPDCSLTADQWHFVRIEKVDNRITLFLDDVLQFSYLSHLPLTGTHVGLLYKDADFEIETLTTSVGSYNIRVSRLAVPDAFLANKNYDKALEEYRRIGDSFPGRAEGREALFRAGVTLLEKARRVKDESLFDRALEEFENLHSTPGAPLEYLGKSLVYKNLQDYHEEINCLELGYRRYRKHPLIALLEEQILYRMHDTSKLDRSATYRFMLLAVQLIPKITTKSNSQRLFTGLRKTWEPLPFIEEPTPFDLTQEVTRWNFAIQLAFWLTKPFSIREILEEVLAAESDSPDKSLTIKNGLFALLEMNANEIVNKLLEKVPAECQHLTSHTESESDSSRIWTHLLDGDVSAAEKIFHNYSLVELSKENHPLHSLYGCWLQATQGTEAALAHFQQVSGSPYPRTSSLLGYFLSKKINLSESGEWFRNAFDWEKKQLFRQLALYAHCRGEEEEARHYQNLVFFGFREV